MSEALQAQVAEEERPCIDHECPGPAEPEMDGPVAYFECVVCGSTFGFRQVAGQDESHCAIGVPESVRRAYAEQHEQASQKVVADNARRLPLYGG